MESTETEHIVEVQGSQGLNDVPQVEVEIKAEEDQSGNSEALVNTSEVTMDVESSASATENKTESQADSYFEYDFKHFSIISQAKKPYEERGTFLKGCKWSNDGTCLMVNSDDNTIRLFDLPQSLYQVRSWPPENIPSDELTPSLLVREGGTIYDYCWYPKMSSWDPVTCCFLSTSANAPVHLWDAFTGQLRATYRGYNHVDEVDSAKCVAFNISGTKLFCGYINEVKIFDTSLPGRDCFSFKTKRPQGQQRGIVSCIVENPGVEGVLAVGTFQKEVGLYTSDGSLLCLLKGHVGGITHMLFSSDGSCLYTGARKDNEILCWDLRSPGKVLAVFPRHVATNQRVYFDLSPDQKYLLSGATDGFTLAWDVTKVSSDKPMEPDCKFLAHKDCTNGISFHPRLEIIATSSGQRHVPEVVSDEEDPSFFSNSNICLKSENSLKLWWVGKVDRNKLLEE